MLYDKVIKGDDRKSLKLNKRTTCISFDFISIYYLFVRTSYIYTWASCCRAVRSGQGLRFD